MGNIIQKNKHMQTQELIIDTPIDVLQKYSQIINKKPITIVYRDEIVGHHFAKLTNIKNLCILFTNLVIRYFIEYNFRFVEDIKLLECDCSNNNILITYSIVDHCIYTNEMFLFKLIIESINQRQLKTNGKNEKFKEFLEKFLQEFIIIPFGKDMAKNKSFFSTAEIL